jgi:hypothetical protein
MQYPAFSRPLLGRFLSGKVTSQIDPDDIDTQINLAEHGRADIVIDSDGAETLGNNELSLLTVQLAASFV